MSRKIEYRYNVGDFIVDNRRHLQIINRYIKTTINPKTNNELHKKIYVFKCKKCGQINERTEVELYAYKKGCACGDNHKVIKGYNDFATLHPELVKYFKYKNNAYEIRENSTKKVELICPDCGKEKIMKPGLLARSGFSCKYCSDGISFPNKFIYNLLDQLNIDYIPEYSPEWAGTKRYDVYFEYNNIKYIIEMNGGWHYKDNNLSGKTAEESKNNDLEKQKLANDNGVKVIFIDAIKSECDYIKSNIISSELNTIFDLSLISWEECEEFATKSFVKTISDYYNANHPSKKELCDKFKLSKNTITRYLKIGADLNICDYINFLDKGNINYINTINEYNQNPNIRITELSEIIGVNRNRIVEYLNKGTKEGLCNYIDKRKKKEAQIELIKSTINEFPEISIPELIKITQIPQTTLRRIYKELQYG